MESTDLLPHKTSLLIRMFQIFFIFLFILGSFFLLYYYLWAKFYHVVDSAIAREAAYSAPSKVCVQDSDCIISCSEGAISKAYYNEHGGLAADCFDGCAQSLNPQNPDRAVCLGGQCAYESGRTCFMKTMPAVIP